MTAPSDDALLTEIPSKILKQLLKIGRYEQRAMFRRKFAIRRLDVARRHAMHSAQIGLFSVREIIFKLATAMQQAPLFDAPPVAPALATLIG